MIKWSKSVPYVNPFNNVENVFFHTGKTKHFSIIIIPNDIVYGTNKPGYTFNICPIDGGFGYGSKVYDSVKGAKIAAASFAEKMETDWILKNL